jgi:hypothetical protein
LHFYDLEMGAFRHVLLFAALTLYVQQTSFTSAYPHTGKALIDLHRAMDVQWTEEEKTILPFPAFQAR